MSAVARGWVETSLLNACLLLTDGTHHSPVNGPVGAFKYVTAKNIKRNGLDLDDITYVDAATHAEIYRRCPVKKGDVLYIKDGATTGIGVVNPLDEQFSVLSSVALLRADPRLLTGEYLCYQLNSPDAFRRLTSDMTGSAIRRLTLGAIGRQRVAIAPLPEQRRIVAKIDSLSAKSRRARDQLDRVPRLVEKYKEALLAAAFRGQLVAYKRHSEFNERPFSEAVLSTFYGPRIASTAYVKEGVPTLRTTDIGEWGLITPKGPPQVSVPEADLEKWRFLDGDLMITRTGATIGKCAVYEARLGPALPSTYLIRVRLKRDKIDPRFAVLFLLSPSGQRQLLAGRTAVAQPNINARAIVALRLPLPSLELQREIVHQIDKSFTWIDRLAKETSSARNLLDHLEQSILAKAFRGELVPQDPNDEPTRRTPRTHSVGAEDNRA